MIRSILFWSLVPLCALQGLWLKRIAQRLPGADGPRLGHSGSGPDLHFVAVGDSIIDGVGVTSTEDSLGVQLAVAIARLNGFAVHWRIEGTTGNRLSDVIKILSQLQADSSVRPDLLVINAGVNDVTSLTGTKRWKKQLESMLDSIAAHWPRCEVILLGVPPMQHFPLPPQPLRYALGLRSARLDAIKAAIASRRSGVEHVATTIDPGIHDFCEDGFHPSAESCRLWAQELAASTGIQAAVDRKEQS